MDKGYKMFKDGKEIKDQDAFRVVFGEKVVYMMVDNWYWIGATIEGCVDQAKVAFQHADELMDDAGIPLALRQKYEKEKAEITDKLKAFEERQIKDILWEELGIVIDHDQAGFIELI